LTARIETSGTERSGALAPLRWVAIVLVVLGLLAVLPLGGPLVLAIWTATMLEPLTKRWAKPLGGRGRAGVVLTVLVFLLILVPLVATGVSLVAAITDLMTKLRGIRQSSDIARMLVPSDLGPSFAHLNPQRIGAFIQRHGADAMQTAQAAFGALTAAAIGLVVYVFGVFECIANGPRAIEWLRERSLVPRAAFGRLVDAFVETGHGLFVGIGGTAVLQTVIATIGYALVGVPQPLLLGFVTLFASLIPSVGTGLVWAPVTALLFATGRISAGVVMLIFGCVAAVADNFVRPWLSRYGHLRLPTFVIFVTMLGGIVVFGGFGLVLGPLFVRLGVEALDIWRERRGADAA
jgi:predicted PurR-regulated permease PerM